MATQAQILANQNNAKRSTGPRTPEGKAIVSQNPLKHGILARQAVINGEKQADFDLYSEQMRTDLAPANLTESMLTERIIALSWRMNRAARAQVQTFDAMKYDKDNPSRSEKLIQSFLARTADQPPSDPSIPQPDLTLGRIAIEDFSNSRVLDRLLMYERRMENSLFKTLLELQRLQYIRKADHETKLCKTNPISKIEKIPQPAV